MDHIRCRSARLYYTTSTRQAGLLLRASSLDFYRAIQAREGAVFFSFLLVPFHRRLQDLRGVPTEAEGRTRPDQASIEKP